MIDLGEMRHRFTLQHATEVVSDTGSTTETWATYDERYGSLEVLSSAEQANSTTLDRCKITMRYVAALAMTDRLLLDGYSYDVTGFVHDGRRLWTEILATKRQTEGLAFLEAAAGGIEGSGQGANSVS